MEKAKTRVFLTGATGVMGSAGLKELVRYPDKYEIRVLARDSKVNHKKLNPFEKMGVRVLWGDLLDEPVVRKGVENSDIVLHVGGMVSPLAEHFPEKTMKVNVGSMALIANIVKEMEDNDPEREIKVVYIGSVSQYGSKLPPNHWGKADDPQEAAKFDAYAESKIAAEMELRKKGLKKWVSIRQTAILHPGLLKKGNDPVTFHVPLGGVLEWITTDDSGRLLERLCREEVPKDFWGKCYNAGGGKPFRLTNLEFERGILKAMSCPSPEKIFDTKWFATQNFHGIWFEDSDQLDEILHFREKDTFEEALERLKKSLPSYYKLAAIVPPALIKAYMKRVASEKELGPLSWIKKGDKERIKAAWGSLEEYEKIPDWKSLKEAKLPKETPKIRKNS